MNWNKFYSAFKMSVTLELTTTKLLAWFIFGVSALIFKEIPEAARSTFLITSWGISAALYGVKTFGDYKKKQLEAPAPSETEPDINLEEFKN